MNKVLTSVFAVVAVGGVLFSLTQWNARATAEAAFAERDLRIAALEKSLRDALDALNSAKDDVSVQKLNAERLAKERDDALKTPTVANADGGAKPEGDAKPQFDMRNVLGNLAKGFDDPEQRKAMKAMNERMVSGAYDKLFKQLGLSEADSKLVSELLGERNFVAMDRGRKLLTGKNDDASVAEVRKDIASTKAEYDAKVKAVLGEDKFRELGNYEQTVADRRSVDGLSREFERKGQPLDESQREKLTTIMIEERLKSPGSANEIPDLGGGPGMQMLMSNEEAKVQQQQEEGYQQRVSARAGEAGLSPDQVITLQESQKRQNDRKTMGRVMGRAFLMPK